MKLLENTTQQLDHLVFVPLEDEIDAVAVFGRETNETGSACYYGGQAGEYHVRINDEKEVATSFKIELAGGHSISGNINPTVGYIKTYENGAVCERSDLSDDVAVAIRKKIWGK